MQSETVIRTDEFPAAFERAATAGRATIIELRTDPDRVGARTVLSQLREQAASSPDR
jgi:acetolactate synthase-1/2/3 large subunit